MMISLLAFLAGLACAWGVGIAVGGAMAGYGGAKLPLWLPATYMADALVDRTNIPQGTAVAVLAILLAAGGVAAHGVFSLTLLGAALLLLGPLACCVCWKVRLDSLSRGKEYVFFNEHAPLGVNQGNIALFIEDDEWVEMPAATAKDLKFWQEFHRGGGLYLCPAENRVLQAIDSLNLYRFIINSQHDKMLDAFEKSLNA